MTWNDVDGSTHVCEFCFNTCNVFCGCAKEKEKIKEEMKREFLNSLYQDLRTTDIQLTVGGEQWT